MRTWAKDCFPRSNALTLRSARLSQTQQHLQTRQPLSRAAPPDARPPGTLAPEQNTSQNNTQGFSQCSGWNESGMTLFQPIYIQQIFFIQSDAQKCPLFEASKTIFKE